MQKKCKILYFLLTNKFITVQNLNEGKNLNQLGGYYGEEKVSNQETS